MANSDARIGMDVYVGTDEASKKLKSFSSDILDNVNIITQAGAKIDKSLSGNAQELKKAIDETKKSLGSLKAQATGFLNQANSAATRGDKKAEAEAIKLHDGLTEAIEIQRKKLSLLNDEKEKADISNHTLLKSIRETVEARRALGERTEENAQQHDLLTEKLTKLRQEQNSLNKEMGIMKSAFPQMQGLVNSVQGLAGAFTAGVGAVSLFVGESESLQNTQKTLQSVMALSMGVTQMSTAVTNSAATGTGIFAAAQRLLEKALVGTRISAQKLMATLTMGLAVAIPIVIAIVDKLTSATRKARKEKEEFDKSLIENTYKSIGSINSLSQQWSALGDNMQAKEKFLKDHREALDKLGVSINSVEQAENVLIKNQKAYIAAQMAKAESEIYYQQTLEKVKEQIKLKQDLEKLEGAKEAAGKRGWVGRNITRSGELEIIDYEKKRIEDKQAELDKAIEEGWKKSSDANVRGINAYKYAGITAITEALNGSVKEIQKEIALLQAALSTAIMDADRNVIQGQIDGLQAYLAAIQSKQGPTPAEQKRLAKEIIDFRRSVAQQAEDAEIDAMKDGADKRKAIIERDHKRNIEQIEKNKEELLKKLSEQKGRKATDEDIDPDTRKAYNILTQLEDERYQQLLDGKDILEQAKNDYKSYTEERIRIAQNFADAQKAIEDKLKDTTLSPEDIAIYNEVLEALLKAKSDFEKKNKDDDFTKQYGVSSEELEQKYKSTLKTRQDIDDTYVKHKTAISAILLDLEGKTDEKSLALRQQYAQREIDLEKWKNDAIAAVSAQEAADTFGVNVKEIEDKYKTIEDKKNDIIQKYENERLYIIAQANKAKTEEDRKMWDDRKKLMEEAMKKELDAFLLKSPDLSTLFGDLSTVSTQALQRAIDTARQIMEDNPNMDPAALKALVEASENASKMISKRNPFQELKKAIIELRKTRKAGEGKDGEDATIGDKEKADKRFNDALEGVKGHMTATLDMVGKIGNAMGKDWSKQIGLAKTAIDGISGAFQKGGSKMEKVSGIVSAAIAVAQLGAEAIDAKYNKSIEAAAERAMKLSAELDAIAAKKGIGDSLFTTDSFNKARQLQEAIKGGFNESLKAGNGFFDAFEKRVKKLPNSTLASILDPINFFGWNSKKFEKNNKGAIEFFQGIRQYNMESLEDVTKMLSDIDVAYAKTKDKLGTVYLDQAKAAAENAKKHIEELNNLIKEMVGDIANTIKDSMALAYRESSSLLSGITKGLNDSIERMLEDRIFNSVFGQVFDTFSKDIVDAIADGSNDAVIGVYSQLYDALSVGIGEFMRQMDKVKDVAQQIGMPLYQEQIDDPKEKLDKDIAALEALQARLIQKAEDAEVRLNELTIERNKIFDTGEWERGRLEAWEREIQYIMDQIKEIEYNIWNKPDSPEQQTWNYDLQFWRGRLGELQSFTEEYTYANDKVLALDKQIAELEKDLFNKENATYIQKTIDALKEDLENYLNSLQYIEDQISAKEKEIKAMSYDELTSDYGKNLIKEKKDLERQREIFLAAMDGDDGFSKALTKLINSEKVKYELYQSWIQEYGEEAANKMITALQTDADAYINSLNEAIDQMEERINSGIATEEDYELLMNWYSQRRAIYDAAAKAAEEAAQKTLDAWTKSFDDAMSNADNAFAKISTIMQKINDLDTSDLSETQREAEKNRLQNMLEAETTALEKTLLKEFETIENKKLRIAQEYQEKINFLREKGYEDEAILAEKARDEELSNLEKSLLEQSNLWKQLFGGDLQKLSKAVATQAVAELRKAVQESTELTDEAREAILGSLDKVQEDINQIELDRLNARLEDTKKKFDDINTAIGAIDGLLKDLGMDSNLSELAGSVTGILGGVGEAVVAFGSGNILGMITSVAKIVGSLAKVFQWFAAQKIQKLTDELDNLTSAYSRLDRAVQKSLGTDTAKYQKEQIDNIEQQIKKIDELVAAEKKKLFTDKEKIAQYESEKEKLKWQQEDIISQMTTDFLLTDAKSLAAQLADILVAPYDSLEERMWAVERASKQLVANIIKNSLQLRYLDKPVNAALDALYKAGGDMGETDVERFFESIATAVTSFDAAAQKLLMPLLKQIDELGATTGRNAYDIKGITEPTAKLLEAQIGAIRIEIVDYHRFIKQAVMNMTGGGDVQNKLYNIVKTIKEDTSVIAAMITSIERKIARYNQMSNKGMGGSLAA